MDCETFQSSEIDALYDELDAAASTAMTEHAATCASCAARFARLRAARERVLAVAVETVPTDFESRIMAAVDAGLANRADATDADADAPDAVRAAIPFDELPSQLARRDRRREKAPAAAPEGGAKILRFMSRPSFAVAATFVLVLGAAALLTARSSKHAPMAVSEESAPAARAEAVADSVAASAVAQATATALVAAAPEAPEAASSGPQALALNEQAAQPRAAAAPAAAMAMAKTGAAESKPTARSSADAQAFASAKALATSGRCGEALPKLEALKATVPEAELYAARCIAQTRGCAAAAPRFDTAAANNSGTEIGSRAAIEGAKCYEANGELAKARQRLVAAKADGILEAEATNELDALDRSGAAAGAGASPRGGYAAPKAAAAAPAPAPPPAQAPVTPPVTPNGK